MSEIVVIDNSSELAAIANYLAQENPQTTIGKLLKFSKGEFLKGVDGEVVPEGSLFAVACDMMLTGYVRWHDGKPVEHKLVRIASGEPLYRREDLGFHDRVEWPKDAKGEPRDPWQAAMYVPMMSSDGEICTFTTSSGSGIKSMQRLLRRYAVHVKRHPGEYPLVKLKVDHYQHSDKSIGKVFYPEFEPAGYVNRAEFVEALEVIGAAVDTADAALPAPKDEFNDVIPY
jgi:hypothetical protein